MVVGALMLLIVTVGLGSLDAPKQLERVVAPPATFFASPDSASNRANTTFVAQLLPKLDVLLGEGLVLKQMGEQRSRNILELTVRMDRFRDAASEIERYLDTTLIPAEYAALSQSLGNGIEWANGAIDGSLSAIRALDWNELGVQVASFARAIESIEQIAAAIEAVDH